MTTNDPGDAPVPPYEGRKTEAEAEETTTKDGVRTGGATAPATSESDPETSVDTERGSVASPADEQPAKDAPDGDSPEKSTGPGHTPGTARGEDQP